MKQISFLIICILFTLNAWCQVTALQDKVTLKTGDVYVGEIVVKTDDLIMIKTKDGSKFQFQVSEISKIEKVASVEESNSQTSAVTEIKTSSDNFTGIIEFAGGISSAKNAFDSSTNTQVSLIFGNKSVLGKQLFFGAGIGYNITSIETKSEVVSFLPLFIRMQNTFSTSRTSPYIGMDAGYAFALNDTYGGGLFAKLSAGISYKISHKTYISLGIYGGINSIATNQIETNDLGTFSYYGNTSMTNYGLKIGLQF